jgi:hypothetical protein
MSDGALRAGRRCAGIPSQLTERAALDGARTSRPDWVGPQPLDAARCADVPPAASACGHTGRGNRALATTSRLVLLGKVAVLTPRDGVLRAAEAVASHRAADGAGASIEPGRTGAQRSSRRARARRERDFWRPERASPICSRWGPGMHADRIRPTFRSNFCRSVDLNAILVAKTRKWLAPSSRLRVRGPLARRGLEDLFFCVWGGTAGAAGAAARARRQRGSRRARAATRRAYSRGRGGGATR